ncbi:hypothetical protein L3C95_28240 [Chitinophaga filiformis]|uniref:hypothetical protein n=1 Tax=Chitinophaga filiformis TaxID=104663 RepID=UPI001F172C6A|nr:hypothetical protein [Chitinophaga filiformis]MCF6406821.1 hypothetical protein [Chitinophaga filiformis]
MSDFEEQVGIISGGIVLEENHRIYIEPTCCGDIGNIVEWEDIHTKLPGEWNQLWIGHPWIYYRTDQQVIEFSGYSESTREELKNTPLLISVSQQDLQGELQKIRLQQDHFELRIQKTLAKMGIDNCERIANLMTGNV